MVKLIHNSLFGTSFFDRIENQFFLGSMETLNDGHAGHAGPMIAICIFLCLIVIIDNVYYVDNSCVCSTLLYRRRI